MAVAEMENSYLSVPDFFELHGAGRGFDLSDIAIASATSQFAREMHESGNYDIPDDEIRKIMEPDVSSRATRHMWFPTPIWSAAMDTVSEWEALVVMADGGGCGVLHVALSPEEQFKQLERVRKNQHAFIEEPKTLGPDATIEDARKIHEKLGFSTIPVLKEGRLVGMIGRRQLERRQAKETLESVMVPFEKLTVSKEMLPIEQAYQTMLDQDINTLPIINDEHELVGMYLFSDVKRVVVENSGIRNVDSKGRYVGAIAITTNMEGMERLELCKELLVDGGGVAVLDSAHGSSPAMYKYTHKALEIANGEFDIVSGNVTDPESALILAQIGADCVKIGQASGEMCITFDKTQIGRGQLTAVWRCAQILKKHGFYDVGVCSDGGMKLPGHLAAAIAVGATTGMVGTAFGAKYESPGEAIEVAPGVWAKHVRGMGSKKALEQRATWFRYGDGTKMPMVEGEDELRVIKGSLVDELADFRAGLRKSMIYAGAKNIQHFQENVRIELRPRRG